MTDETPNWTQLKVNLALVLRGDIDELKSLVKEINKKAVDPETSLDLVYKTLSANRLYVTETPQPRRERTEEELDDRRH